MHELKKVEGNHVSSAFAQFSYPVYASGCLVADEKLIMQGDLSLYKICHVKL
jgi:hypothetical protein